MADQLSPSQCILLAVHYASQSNIKALHAFTPTRQDAFDPELVLRILLSYLPETVEPSSYTTYINEVYSRTYLEQQAPVELDISSVKDLSDSAAQKRVKKLRLLDLIPPDFPPHAPQDVLTRFLCHRAYMIDTETGLLTLVPQLFVPFLDRSDFLRTWFVSVVLPVLRFGYEYYPGSEAPLSLRDFEKLEGAKGIELLLSKAKYAKHEIISATDSEGTVGRDLRGLVGPWIYGHTERKRRKLDEQDSARTSKGNKRISLSGVSDGDKTGHDWEYTFKWMVHQATENFPLVTNAIEEWDGPSDVDLGGYGDGHHYMDDDLQAKFERQYAQASFASCYAVALDSPETIDGAHGILVRLAELLDFEPPPDLAASVEQLPKVDSHASMLHESESTTVLEPDSLLRPEHPLTTPRMETYMLLQMLVYSAYQLAGLGHNISIVNVARLRFFSDEDEQMALMQKILHGLCQNGKRDDQEWTNDRNKLLWLWDWGIDKNEGAVRGAGIFGNIDRSYFEREALNAIIGTSNLSLAIHLYVLHLPPTARLAQEEVRQVVLDQAMYCYDNASNGNRTRGGMKKASDIINTFSPHFPNSLDFKQASSLIAATHSLSFYSLTLQHGVPFQPVNIRVSKDPLSLLEKVLEQNSNSYTNLDDLINIGRNLVSAGLPQEEAGNGPTIERQESQVEKSAKLTHAERRVIAMCIESALASDDFETAYSYIMNRLSPDSASLPLSLSPSPPAVSNPAPTPDDDPAWRAAFLAGRYRGHTATPPSLRRLEQRTELLSLALLIAPPSALSEILTVWRRCEEEMTALLAREADAERRFNDAADKRVHAGSSGLPGGFDDDGTKGMVFNQPRREMGRVGLSGGEAKPGAHSRTGTTAGARRQAQEEAPMGLFDVARGAARAFGRTFPRAANASSAESEGLESSTDSLGHASLSGGSDGGAGAGERVRRRDMVANAVTGGLASGIGWVLGATPADRGD